MRVIIVTGTPGSGKTTLARKLANKLDIQYLDVNHLISQKKLEQGYDKKRKAKIIDTKKLSKALLQEIKQTKKAKKCHGLVIDSHLSHYLPSKHVDICIVTKCDLKELQKRLKKRKYSKAKIRENLDAEIFDVCLQEAKGLDHKIVVFDTTSPMPKTAIQDLIISIKK